MEGEQYRNVIFKNQRGFNILCIHTNTVRITGHSRTVCSSNWHTVVPHCSGSIVISGKLADAHPLTQITTRQLRAYVQNMGSRWKCLKYGFLSKMSKIWVNVQNMGSRWKCPKWWSIRVIFYVGAYSWCLSNNSFASSSAWNWSEMEVDGTSCNPDGHQSVR